MLPGTSVRPQATAVASQRYLSAVALFRRLTSQLLQLLKSIHPQAISAPPIDFRRPRRTSTALNVMMRFTVYLAASFLLASFVAAEDFSGWSQGRATHVSIAAL
jgi:hypothetical protein